MKKINKVFSIIVTALIIVIIIYLIGSVKQPYVSCSRSRVDDLGITLKEDLVATLNSNKIRRMEVVKTIVLPNKYLVDDKYLNEIKFLLEKSYEYLDKDTFKVFIDSNKIIVKIDVSNSETIILNNIEFFDNDGLVIKINPNTKSSEVVTLSILDKYSEGELLTRMKNNGYKCK